MIIDPSLLTHMKFIRLKRKLPAAYRAQALEFLLALWAHCQVDQRGENWGPVEDDYIEDVCGWQGGAGELAAVLKSVLVPGKNPWVRRDEAGNLIIVGWNERNAGMISNWRRNPGGNRKARATSTAPGNTEGKPMAQPVTNSTAHPVGEPDDLPEESPSGGARGVPHGVAHGPPDKIREEKTREERRGDAREPASAGSVPGPSTAPPPTFLPVDSQLFQRELCTLPETAKHELRWLPEGVGLTGQRLSPEPADLVVLLEREGNAVRARAVTEDRRNWRPVLSDLGQRHPAAWKQRIAALDAALKGGVDERGAGSAERKIRTVRRRLRGPECFRMAPEVTRWGERPLLPWRKLKISETNQPSESMALCLWRTASGLSPGFSAESASEGCLGWSEPHERSPRDRRGRTAAGLKA